MNRTITGSLIFLLLSGTALANPNAQRPDLPPPQIVAKVLEESPAVQSAKSGIDLGQANNRKLDSGPYEFNASGLTQRRKVRNTENDSLNEWGVELERAFRIPGKGGIDSDIGDAGMDAASFAYSDAYHEAARTLLSQWFDWVKAKSEVAQWQEQTASFNQQLSVVTKREKVGDAAKLEASMAEAASAQADASLKQAEARLQIAASVLLQTYPGLVLPEDITLADPEPVEGTLEEWSKKILANNHEMKRAQAESLQAKLQADRARLDQIPDPTIGVQYGSEQGGSERYMGLRLSIPIPGTGIRSAEVDTARAQASIASQKEALTTRSIMNNIAAVYARAASGYSSWQSANLARESIDQNANKMARAYELGEVGLTDLLTAQRLRAESALTSNATRIETIEARYRLLLDSHQLWLPQELQAEHPDAHESHAEELPKVAPATVETPKTEPQPLAPTASGEEALIGHMKEPDAAAAQPKPLIEPPVDTSITPVMETPMPAETSPPSDLPWLTPFDATTINN